MTNRLSGKVAIITGGSSGIGLATVQRFQREGAAVVSADIAPLPISLNDVSNIVAVNCDVTQPADVERAVAATLSQFGQIDILVNCAATLSPIAPVSELTLTDWEWAFRVNLTGAFLMSKAVLPEMKRKGGSIVNVASEIGIAASAGRAAYGASKAALIHLTKVMALDHASDRIRVNAISPGAVVTDRLLARFDTPTMAEEALRHLYPMNRLGTTDEIANGILFLASGEASFMTGANMVMDGGYNAR